MMICALWGAATFAANPLEGGVQGYEAQDLLYPPPSNAVVVTGSSTIQLWTTIGSDLAPLPIISRGLGGSTADDIDYYLDRIVLVYHPRAVVLYEGDNDIAGGATPQYVANRIEGIMGRITARYPNTRVYVISIKPSVARWSLWPQMSQANQLLAAFCTTDVRYTFLDVTWALLGSNGQPRPEFYATGGLHLNTAGYQAWNSVIRPVLIAQQSIPVPADYIAPTMPTGLHATAGGPNRVDLYWNASTDNGSGLGGYGIYRDGSLIATSSSLWFSDYSVAANTYYTYRVNAYDRAIPPVNQSGLSFSVDVTTPTSGPVPTITLTASPATVVTGGTAQLSWSTANASWCTASGGWSGSRNLSGSTTTQALSANTTFVLYCSGPGGNSTATLVVTVTAPVPTVSLSANPTSVVSGNTSQLTWSSTNASSCTASGGWSGSRSTSGSVTTQALTANTTFALNCSGSGGNTTATVVVTVTTPPPTVTLGANPASIFSGSTAQLSWSTTNANSCTASGGWSGSRGTSGTATTAALSANATYTLTCSGDGGSATAAVLVTVTTPPPTVTLAANPGSIPSGSTAQLSWSSTNATSCTASGGWSGSRGISGTATTAALSANSTYTLTCNGDGGSATATTQVLVTAPPPPPPPVPTMSFTSSAATVVRGSTIQLSWNGTNIQSCTASGSWSGARDASGTETSQPLQGAATFTLICQGPGGTKSGTIDVAVTQPPPTVKISAAPATMAAGSRTQLTWSTTDADSCVATGDWSGTKAASGAEETAALSVDAHYTLNCTGSGGSSSANVAVTVSTQPTPLPAVTVAASSSGGGGAMGTRELCALLMFAAALRMRKKSWSRQRD